MNAQDAQNAHDYPLCECCGNSQNYCQNGNDALGNATMDMTDATNISRCDCSDCRNVMDVVAMFDDVVEPCDCRTKQEIAVCNRLVAVIEELRRNGVIEDVRAVKAMLALTAD